MYEFTGTVSEVCDVQTFASGFTKREVVVGNDVDSPSKYPNPVKFTFKKDNCSLLDGIQKGQRTKIHFVIDGTLFLHAHCIRNHTCKFTCC